MLKKKFTGDFISSTGSENRFLFTVFLAQLSVKTDFSMTVLSYLPLKNPYWIELFLSISTN
jgi:hypothetical protein